MSDLTALREGGWLNEPYTLERVVAACREVPEPFMLREVVQASGLPTHIVHERLRRLVKKGVLQRSFGVMRFNSVTGGRGGPQGVRLRPMGQKRRCYLYSFVKADAE